MISLSILTKLFGKPKKEIKEIASDTADKMSPREPENTGTTPRHRGESTRITKKKPGPELTALELADRQDWEVKTLPVWQPGDVIIDTYEVEDVISGGMGHVYIANHKHWNVKLAIKSPNEMMLADRDFFARILREANSWTELGLHPNIAYCYYVRNIEDVPHIFVEYVDGGNLRQWIEDGRCIDYRTSLDLAIQFCHGMEHAHSKGMIHRDIKPENLLMTKDGILKITDFGLVRGNGTGDIQSSVEQGVSDQPTGHGLTAVGTLMGTEGYMAPEQAESAGDVDEPADIFSFGVCLYEMFCGNKPYDITYGPRQESSNPRLLSRDENFPDDIAAVLTSCVQWEPRNRYLKFTEIRQELIEIYERLFDQESPYAELELLGLEADGLNNRGVAYFELNRKEDAIACWENALKVNQIHPEATYNLSLNLWRDGKVADDEVLRRLDNCENNPSTTQERLAELKAYVFAERFDSAAARDVLKNFPGKYEEHFSEKNIGLIECVRTMEGHVESVNSVCLTPDGRYAISGSEDTTIRLWDLQAGQCLCTLKGHTDTVQAVALTVDGRYGVSGSADKTIRLWNLETGQCLRTMEGHADSVRSVCFTPDGRNVLSGSADRTIRLWDLETGQCLRTMEGHIQVVYSVSISGDGKYAVSGGYDGTIRMWDLETGQCLRIIKENLSVVYSVSISADGRYAVAGNLYNTVHLVDLDSGRYLRSMEGHSMGVNSVVINPDGRYAVSGSVDGTARLWDLKNGRCLRTMKGHTGIVQSVCRTPDGRYAVSGGMDKTIRLWNLDTATSYQSEPMVSLPKGFAQRKKEEEILNKAVRKAEEFFKKGEYKQALETLLKAWENAAFSHRDQINRLYSKLMKKGKIKGLVFSFQKKMLELDAGGRVSVSLSADGRYVIEGSREFPVKLWDLETGQCLHTMEGHTGIVESACLSPDGRYAVSGSGDRTVRFWNLETGQCQSVLKGHTSFIRTVSLTPDGRYAVSGSQDTTIRLWDLETGHCLRTMEGHVGEVNSVSHTPDGRYAVSGSEDKTVRFWNIETGQCLCTMEGHDSSVNSVCLAPDGRFAVSGGGDKTIRIWDLKTGQCLRTMEGHTISVNAVTLSPDLRYVISGSGDKTVRLWDLETGQCLNILTGHTLAIESVAISADLGYAVSGSGDKTIRWWEYIWDLEFD